MAKSSSYIAGWSAARPVAPISDSREQAAHELGCHRAGFRRLGETTRSRTWQTRLWKNPRVARFSTPHSSSRCRGQSSLSRRRAIGRQDSPVRLAAGAVVGLVVGVADPLHGGAADRAGLPETGHAPPSLYGTPSPSPAIPRRSRRGAAQSIRSERFASRCKAAPLRSRSTSAIAPAAIAERDEESRPSTRCRSR